MEEENKKEESNKGGAPPFFQTVEELQIKIDQYFRSDLNKRKIVIGKVPNERVIEVPIPTLTGLAYYLGFASRQSLYDYEEREGFSYTIKRARLFIERDYEEQLQYGNVTGAIFALKNLGWKDKTESEITGPDGGPIAFSKIERVIIDPDAKDAPD